MLFPLLQTLREYLCAEGLGAGLRRVLQDESVPLESMKRVLLDLASTKKPPPTVTAQSSESKDIEKLVPQEQRRASEVVAGLAEKLLQSAWAQVDLPHEAGACDFLADRLCSDPGLVSELEILGLWLTGIAKEAQRETRSLLQESHKTRSDIASANVEVARQATSSRGEAVVNMLPQEREGRLEQLKLNLLATLTVKLPNRHGGSMIHVAASDGGYVLLSGVICILKLILPSHQWEQILDSR